MEAWGLNPSNWCEVSSQAEQHRSHLCHATNFCSGKFARTDRVSGTMIFGDYLGA